MEYINFDIEHVNHIANDTLTPEDLTKYAKRPYFECPRDISFLQPDDKSFIEMFDWKNFSLDDKYFFKNFLKFYSISKAVMAHQNLT